MVTHSKLKVAGDPDMCGNSFYVSRFEGGQYMVSMTRPAKALVDAEIARRGADATVDGPYVGRRGRHKFFLVTGMSNNAQASLLKAAVSSVADAAAGGGAPPAASSRKRKRQAPMISETGPPPWATNVPSSDYFRDALQLNEDLVNRGVPDDLRLKAAQFFADGEWKTLQELKDLGKELRSSLRNSEAGRAIIPKVMRLFSALNSVLHLAERRRRDWESRRNPVENQNPADVERARTQASRDARVARWVEVYWAGDGEWFLGRVAGQREGKLRIAYTDGEELYQVLQDEPFAGDGDPPAPADGEPEPWRYAEAPPPPPPPPPQRKADDGSATAPAPAQAELDDRDCPLVCPIAMDGHMREPVTLPCGCNFEKESVTEWFRRESTCPKCRKKMPRGFDASTLGVNKLIQQNAASLCKCKVFSRD